MAVQAREKDKASKGNAPDASSNPPSTHSASKAGGKHEHLHAAASTEIASVVGQGKDKKHGKGKKKGGPDLDKYAHLPDDISVGKGGTLPKGVKLNNVFQGGGDAGGGGGSRGPEFPSWACTADRIQHASKIVRPTNTNLLDTEGRPIHAHGGSFVAPGQGGAPHKRWWWYGESAKNNPLNAGVNAYSSSDLLTWKFEGSMISQKTILGKLRQLKTSSAFEVLDAPPPHTHFLVLGWGP